MECSASVKHFRWNLHPALVVNTPNFGVVKIDAIFTRGPVASSVARFFADFRFAVPAGLVDSEDRVRGSVRGYFV